MGDTIVEGRSLVNIERCLLEEIQGKELWGDLNISIEEYEILREIIADTLEIMSIENICKRYPLSLTTLMVFLICNTPLCRIVYHRSGSGSPVFC